MPIRERVLLDVARIRMRTLLCQIQLTVHIEVVHLLQGHASALLSFSGCVCVIRGLAIIVIIRASLAIGSFLLDDKLLSRVCIYLVHLRQLLLLLDRLELLSRLLLLVFFQAFLALIACQLAVIRAFGHALRLGTACRVCIARALRSNCIWATCAAFCGPLARLVTAVGSTCSSEIGRFDLSIDRILVLAGGVVPSDSNLASIVLMVS